jgi:TolB protein
MIQSIKSLEHRWAARRALLVFLATAIALGVIGGTANAVAGDNTLVSVNKDGTATGNGNNEQPRISGNGQYVVFASMADDLVANDTTQGNRDVFIRDLKSGKTELISVDSNEAQGTATEQNDFTTSVSDDGRFVAFASTSALAPGDSNDRWDVFVRDRQLGTTKLVSVTYDGSASNGDSLYPSISADGRYVAYSSSSTKLVDPAVSVDENMDEDVFVRDMVNNTTERVSLDNAGNEINIGGPNDFSNGSSLPSISGDGKYVAFQSYDPLAGSESVQGSPDATENNSLDIFVRDLVNKRTELVSVDANGKVGSANSYNAHISKDGKFVSFATRNGLVADDTNNNDDVFLRDLTNKTTKRASVADDGSEASGGDSYDGFVGGENGRYVLFASTAANLLGPNNDVNDKDDVFIRDRQNGTTRIVSVRPDGVAGNDHSYFPTISADGSLVAFESLATNLVSQSDTNGAYDVFVHEMPGTNTSTPPTDSASQTVAAGSTVSTATGDGTASASDPINTSITTPVAGTISISETSTTQQAPSGFTFFGQQINIEAPQASVQQPLSLQFVIDSSLMPSGTDYTNVQLFRDGVRIEPCDGGTSATSASPDPCIKQRTLLADGDAQITVLSSHASQWNIGVAKAGTPLYSFKGFFQPVDNLPTVNTVKAGAAVPVKFSLGGDKGLDIFATDYPLSGSVPSDPSASLDAIEQTVTASASGLSYSATSGQYTYTWKTDKTWAGKTRQLVIRFKDGTEHKANFKFTK